MFKFFKKKFIKYAMHGKNNRIFVIEKDNIYKLRRSIKGLNISVVGNNNRIIFDNYDKLCVLRRQLRGLVICIEGDSNMVRIKLPNKFNGTMIELKGEGNYFELNDSIYPLRYNCRFFAYDGGQIMIGRNCQLNDNLYIKIEDDYKTKHKIVIKDNVFIAMDVIIRASDGHSFLDKNTGYPLNEPQDIIIDEHCWIMARSIILKGTHLCHDTAVGAQSLVNKKFEQPYLLLAGTPAKIIRKDIRWVKQGYRTVMKMNGL